MICVINSDMVVTPGICFKTEYPPAEVEYNEEDLEEFIEMYENGLFYTAWVKMNEEAIETLRSFRYW